jgi:hypothetical protein
VPAAVETTAAVVAVVVPMWATVVSLLVHVPPPVVQLRVVAPPAHRVSVPAIAEGGVLTVTIAVLRQPVGAVYDTTAVPAVTPVIIPAAESTATLVERELHVPPDVALLSVVVPPMQTDSVPVIVGGSEFTVA